MKPDNMKKKYNFFLNPYTDCAFSKCPGCENSTKTKKLPLAIAIEKRKAFLILNKTCKFCPYCELIIARKKEIENLLREKFGEELSEKDYFIMGTIERSNFVEGVSVMGEHFFDNMYIFKDMWGFESTRPRWVKK